MGPPTLTSPHPSGEDVKGMDFQFTAVFRLAPEGYITFVEELPGANTIALCLSGNVHRGYWQQQFCAGYKIRGTYMTRPLLVQDSTGRSSQ